MKIIEMNIIPCIQVLSVPFNNNVIYHLSPNNTTLLRSLHPLIYLSTMIASKRKYHINQLKHPVTALSLHMNKLIDHMV